MTKRLKDIVEWRPEEDLPKHIHELAQKLHLLVASITATVPRTNASVAIAKLGRQSAIELERVSTFYPSLIEGVAWSTRNIFELNLILRFILKDQKNMDAWLGQLAGDEVQILEGLLTLANGAKLEHISTLRNRLIEISAICKRHGIKPSKPFQIAELARLMNRSEDYNALYKLFSKYVHPSSWLVNNSEEILQNSDTLNIFVIHAQLYSGDSYVRLDEWLKKQAI